MKVQNNNLFIIEDNSLREAPSGQVLEDLRRVAGLPLEDLCDEEGNELWLFPTKEERYDDRIEDQALLSIEGKTIRTGNIMGFVGVGSTELTIRSRFSGRGGNDWFMQYMLERIFAINVFDSDHSIANLDALGIAVFLFPYYLQKALRQGLYREYRRMEYNDSRIRGTIDFNRYIKQNYPFLNGRVSYSVKEYCFDNPITQLVRHTIEFIKSQERFSYILFANQDTREDVQTIIDATPSFRRGDLIRTLSQNMRPKVHPYYTEYSPLQRLCLQILLNEKIGFGDNSERIHGILFDGAWLWEEYLSLSLEKMDFKHPENRKGEGGIPVYTGQHKRRVYPDYIHPKVIADAKYKRLYRKSDLKEKIGIPRDDLYQMISYLHITDKDVGVFICPRESFENPGIEGDSGKTIKGWSTLCYHVGQLEGRGGNIYVLVVNIPQDSPDYVSFRAQMSRVETSIRTDLKRLVSGEGKDVDYPYE